MTVKEIGKYLYSGQLVRLMHENHTVAMSYADELQKSYYKDSEIELGSIHSTHGNVISFRLSEIIEPANQQMEIGL